jgi:hypothetical protein
MKKIFFILLLTFFSLGAKSQIMDNISIELDSSKSVDLTMYKLVSIYHPFGLKTYLFGVDFFGFSDEPTPKKLHIITSDGKIISLKEKRKLSEKETVYFQIWRKRINPDKIDLVIYQDKSGNYYKFKLKKHKL